MLRRAHLAPLLLLAMISCSREPTEKAPARPEAQATSARPAEGVPAPSRKEPPAKPTVHVFVALCDNASQGIVPVPAQLGNGDDPRNNLYWGAMYGVRTFLDKSEAWRLMRTETDPTADVLERCIFRHADRDLYLVADAYRGDRIRTCVEDFLKAAAGNGGGAVECGRDRLGVRGAAELVAYVGHNGLMEFSLPDPKPVAGATPRGAIVLACKSRPYFGPRLARIGCRPVLLTTCLMAPEAYTLVAGVEGWAGGEGAPQIRERAARAYDRYQKCGPSAAKRLFHAE